MCCLRCFRQFCSKCSWKSAPIVSGDLIHPGEFDYSPKVCPKCGAKLEFRTEKLSSVDFYRPWWKFW